ncbi:MAG TPA: DUF4382 domain-containing protein [Candidatus Acidoferrales bacterium]|nr:DUF4382 domain-containing protein [Candidatus Acidoferrales bacterium]
MSLVACAAPAQTSPAPAAPSGAATGPAKHTGPRDVIGGGHLNVLLGDASLPTGSGVQAIDLGIDAIAVTDGNGNVTTVASFASPQVVNVLQYQGGNAVTIGQGSVPETTFASLTLVVDRASSTWVDSSGTSHPLQLVNEKTQSSAGFGADTVLSPPPSPNSGAVAITFDQPFQVAGQSVNVNVDFNALESFAPQTSSGVSRPSLSVAQQAFEGSISGTVLNAAGSPVTHAVVVAVDGNGNADATAATDQNGNFLLHTLNGGTYHLAIYNTYTTATGWSISAAGADSTGTVAGPAAGVSPGATDNVGKISD